MLAKFTLPNIAQCEFIKPTKNLLALKHSPSQVLFLDPFSLAPRSKLDNNKPAHCVLFWSDFYFVGLESRITVYNAEFMAVQYLKVKATPRCIHRVFDQILIGQNDGWLTVVQTSTDVS